MDEVEVRVILLFQVGLISDKKRKKNDTRFSAKCSWQTFFTEYACFNLGGLQYVLK